MIIGHTTPTGSPRPEPIITASIDNIQYRIEIYTDRPEAGQDYNPTELTNTLYQIDRPEHSQYRLDLTNKS